MSLYLLLFSIATPIIAYIVLRDRARHPVLLAVGVFCICVIGSLAFLSFILRQMD